MVFKSFYVRAAVRILLLTILLLLFSLCLVQGLYLRSVYMAVFVIGLATELFFFITRFTGNIQAFLNSVHQLDFSFHFQEKGIFGKLHGEMNRINSLFKSIRTEKEIQHRFLSTLVEHISIGIISFDFSGNVQLVNSAFLNFVSRTHLQSLQQLENGNPEILGHIREIEPGETRVVKMIRHQALQSVALYASEFKLDDQSFKLISLQNITAELNAHELEAWQKLIRVLTHEIMNSIAPIVSLSGTLHTMVGNEQTEKASPVLQTLHSGLEAIKIRSEGLQHFTEAYRQLSRIPHPEFVQVDARIFIQQTLTLLGTELESKRIHIETNIETLTLLLDRNLMEQALLNLLQNAIEALESRENPRIKITVRSMSNRIYFSVEDNGAGMDGSQLDKIFVPFYTTKKNGSGIGLALVRQIVQLHKGEIAVQSAPGAGANFTVIL